MKLLEYTMPNDFNIFHFGDQHLGAGLSSKDGWRKLVNMMHSKYEGCRNNYGIDGGDAIEAITVDDKRFSAEQLKQARPLEQMDNAVKDREPIKGMLLAMLTGNHEDKLWRFGDLTSKMCDTMGVPYGTWTCKITIKDKNGNLMFKIFETHGRRNINSIADDDIRFKSNMNLILKRHLKHKAGDCAVMIKHHAHKLLVAEPTHRLYLTDNGSQIQQHYTSWWQNEDYIHPDSRWYGCAGSFLRLYGLDVSGYAEKAEYDPTELGFLVLIVRDRKIQDLRPVYLDI